MTDEKFNPIAHDSAFVAQMLSDSETKRVYDELEDEYAALNDVLAPDVVNSHKLFQRG